MLVALEDGDSSASGELFLDNDDEVGMEIRPKTSTHLKFEASLSGMRGSIRSNVTYGEWAEEQGLYVHRIAVLGVQTKPSSVTIDGAAAPQSVKVEFNTTTSMLEISGLQLSAGKDFGLVWDDVSTPNAPADPSVASS